MAWDLTEREQLWCERIACQAEGGMTVTEFCDSISVSTAAFYQWRKRLGRNSRTTQRSNGELGDADGGIGDSLFVPVAVRESSGESIRLELGHELMVHVPDGVSEERLVTIFRAALSAKESTPC
jgi:transposase-like protein